MLKTCKGCGAELKYKADSLSLKCAYCGALNEVTKTVVKTVVSDEKIIPLAITQDELKERVYSYICSNYKTSDEISEDISFSKLDCFYVPVFLFYIKYDATWTASFGYDKAIEINHYKKTTYKNVTDWQPTNGIDKGTFTLFAYAGELLTDSDLSPIDMIPSLVAEGKIRNFDPSFLIGVPVEEAIYPESDAFISLEADMNAEIDERIKLHSQGDHQKDWYWTSEETHITKTLYVPFCHAVFDYQGIDYNFWVGGIDESEVRADSLPIGRQQTDKHSLYPKESYFGESIVYILLALIVMLFAVFLIGKIVNPTDVEVKSVTPKSTESRKITKSQLESSSEDLAKNLVLKMLEYAMNDGGLSNESQIQEIKLQIEGFAKPAKGNKKSAREVNDQALSLFNKNNDVDAAVTLFAEANKLDPSDVEILNNLGYLLTKQGDTELAKTILINALILAPSRTNAWLNLGDIFGITGDKERAVACFSNAFRFSKNKKKTQVLMEKWNEKENVESLKESRILAIEWAKRTYSNDQDVENKLINALRLKNGSTERVESFFINAHKAYVQEGIINEDATQRQEYTDYFILHKPAKFLGHELMVIEAEYMSEWIGCCVNPGTGVIVRLVGGTKNLEEFANANKCSLTNNINPKEQISDFDFPQGIYATLSCRERDIKI